MSARRAEPDTYIDAARPLTVWAVSDGRIGIQNQVLGLAEAISRLTPSEIVIKRLRYARRYDPLPSWLKLFPDRMLDYDSSSLEAPYPDIWIAAGRSTIPHSTRIRQRSKGKTLVVQLQNPRWPLKDFDLVIAPEHDHLSGPNSLSLIGSTNRLTPQLIQQTYEQWRDQIDNLPHPRICTLIGGDSKAFAMDDATAQTLADEIAGVVRHSGGSLLLTLSRRTPATARKIFKEALKGLPGIFFDDQGRNPYFAFLYAADHFLISEDSVNMAAEAATTGKPIQILSLTRKTLGSGSKFVDFHESLRARGISHPFNGTLAGAPYPPLVETERAAHEVLRVFHEKYPQAHLL